MNWGAADVGAVAYQGKEGRNGDVLIPSPVCPIVDDEARGSDGGKRLRCVRSCNGETPGFFPRGVNIPDYSSLEEMEVRGRCGSQAVAAELLDR